MAKAVTLTFDARLGPAAQKFVQLAQKVQGVEKGVQKLTQAAGKAATQLERTGDSGKGAGKKADSAFAGLKSTLTGLVGAGGALALARSLFTSIKEEAEGAAEKILALRDASAELVQVSKTPQQFERNVLLAELISLQEAIPRTTARQFVFQGRSFGVEEAELLEIAKSKRFTRAGGAGRFMEAVGKFRAPAAYGPEAGTGRQLISAFLAAGEPADIQSDIIAQASVKALQQAQAIGTGPDELLALMSVVSPGFATPEEAATGLRSLAVMLGREGYGGRGILAGLGRFRAEKPERAVEALQSEVRAKAASEAIGKSEALIQQRLAEVSYARRTGAAFDEKLRIAAAPQLTQADEFRKLEILEDLTLEKRGGVELEYQKTQRAAKVMGIEAGETPFLRWLREKTVGAIRAVAGPEAAIRSIEDEMGVSAPDLIEGAIGQMTDRLGGKLDALGENRRGGAELAPRGTIQNVEEALQENSAPPQVPGGAELRPTRADDYEGTLGQGLVIIGVEG